MNKNNLLMLYFYFASMIFINLFEVDLLFLITYFFITYLVYMFFSLSKFKSLKKFFLSSEVIFETVFFVYSIMSAVMFVIDGYRPRVDFFRIDYDTILRTLYLYFNINCIFIIFTLLKKGPETFDCSKELTDYCKNSPKKIDLWDVLAIVLTLYFLYLHFRNGLSFISMHNRELRILIDSGLNSYVYLYMISYSAIRYTEIIYNFPIILKKHMISIVVTMLFWMISLLTDRRNIINLIVIVIMVLFTKLKKIKIKLILKILVIFLAFLSWGYFRNGTQFSKDRITELFYMSNGEFILSHYVSEYYINNHDDLKYGKTYTFDTMTKLIPRAIYPNKPEDLSITFYKEAKTNVGFAFNPVAEGIINFGIAGATIFVPLVIMFYVFLAKKMSKYNIFNYFMLCGYSINIFRGFFANTAFAILFMTIIIYFMTKKTFRKKVKL